MDLSAVMLMPCDYECLVLAAGYAASGVCSCIGTGVRWHGPRLGEMIRVGSSSCGVPPWLQLSKASCPWLLFGSVKLECWIGRAYGTLSKHVFGRCC